MYLAFRLHFLLINLTVYIGTLRTHHRHIGLILVEHFRAGISMVTEIIHHALKTRITTDHLRDLSRRRLIWHGVLHG